MQDYTTEELLKIRDNLVILKGFGLNVEDMLKETEEEIIRRES